MYLKLDKCYADVINLFVWGLTFIKQPFNLLLELLSMLKYKEQDIHDYAILVSDHVPAMLAYWDSNLFCRFANHAYLDWFGVRREDMIDKMHISELLGNSLYELNMPFIEGVLSGLPQFFERELIKPNQQKCVVMANYIPHVENGVVLGFVAHVSDITTVRNLESDVLESHSTIRKQNSRLLNFANIVSHNLRNHAQSFSGLTALLQLQQNPELQQLYLAQLQQASDHFTRTVNNLAEVAKMQHASSQLMAQVNLAEFVKQVVGSLSFQWNETGSKVHVHIPEQVLIQTNKAYFESIMLNLLSNAMKYRSPDRQLAVHINFQQHDRFGVLEVIDNGLGIDIAKHGAHVFELYKTFHGNADASGIGLYITKCQIEEMNWRIEVDSEVNKGTRFRIKIPMV